MSSVENINEYTPSKSLSGVKQVKGSAPEPAQPEMPETIDDEPYEEPVDDVVIAGINSEVYPDSLINLLKPLDFLTKEERGQLLILMLDATKEDNVVLEAIGDADSDPRKFSSSTTTKLNNLIASFRLPREDRKKLEMTLMRWARLNTVKFSSSNATEPEDDTDIDLSPKASIDPRDLPEPGPGAAEFEDESAPEEFDPIEPATAAEPKELTYTASDGETFKATDKTALSRSIKFFLPDINDGPQSLDIAIKNTERILKMGGGLTFANMRTDKMSDKPKWVSTPDGGIVLPYYGVFVAPKKITNRIKDILSNPIPGFGPKSRAQFTDKVSQQSINNLKKYLALAKQEKQKREQLPVDSDEYQLQESFKRMQDLAGINKRII